MNILEYLVDNFKICWKEHADAPVPQFDEEQVNIFKFNNDSEEPLRDKLVDCYIEDDIVKIYWICQEEWYSDLYGMKEEITRWAKYWINKYKKANSNIDKVVISVFVKDRDDCMNDAFEITI